MSDITEGLGMDEVIARFRRSSTDAPQWSAPRSGMWDTISNELGFANPTTQAPPTAAAQDSLPTNPSRRNLFFGLGGVLVGAGLGVAGVAVADSVRKAPNASVKRAVLTPLDKEDEKLGIAELRPQQVGYTLAVDVPAGARHPGGYIEVWLINVDLKRMISVGIFAAGTPARFFIDDALIDAGYLIVDLSNEEFDGEVRHSGDTIMRGELLA